MNQRIKSIRSMKNSRIHYNLGVDRWDPQLWRQVRPTTLAPVPLSPHAEALKNPPPKDNVATPVDDEGGRNRLSMPLRRRQSLAPPPVNLPSARVRDQPVPQSSSLGHIRTSPSLVFLLRPYLTGDELTLATEGRVKKVTDL
jgi:hypothetical protein